MFFYTLILVKKTCLEFARAAIPHWLYLSTLDNLVAGLPHATFVVLKPLIIALKHSALGKVLDYLPQLLRTLIHLLQDVLCEQDEKSEGIFSEQLQPFVTFELPHGKSCSGLVRSLDRPDCGKNIGILKVKTRTTKEFKPYVDLNILPLLSQCFQMSTF